MVKFSEVKNYQKQLSQESGLYFFYVNGKLKYVGQSKDLWWRFTGGYLKKGTKQHVNSRMLNLIETNPDEIEVLFVLMEKELLKITETLFIQKNIPEFNEIENPRRERHSVQKVIGRIVTESNRQWTFSEMRYYLYEGWNKRIPYDHIDEALADYKNLTNHCKQSQKRQTLNPKK